VYINRYITSLIVYCTVFTYTDVLSKVLRGKVLKDKMHGAHVSLQLKFKSPSGKC
jgi:hypothetical protein